MFPWFVLNKSINDINMSEDPEILDFLTEDVVRYFRSLILKIIKVIDYVEYRYKDIFHPTSKMSPISFHLYSLGSSLSVNNSKHLVFLCTFVDLWKYFKFIVVLVFLFNIGLKDRLSRTAFDSFHYHCPLQLVMYRATLKVFHSRLSSSA